MTIALAGPSSAKEKAKIPPPGPVGELGETDETVRKVDAVFVRTFSEPKVGQFHIVLRSDGHQLGLPYLFEIRSTCGGGRKDWMKLPPANVVSACGVEKKTVNYDAAKRSVSMKVYAPDWEEFEKRVADAGGNQGAMEPKCKKTSELAVMSLDDICKE